MSNIDKRHKLDADVFSYHVTKSGTVLLYWYDKQVKILKGQPAQKFLARMDGLDGRDAQLVMAKATGNFKRGNERRQ